MTEAELFALPEWPTGFGYEDRIIDGQKCRIPVAPPMAAMYHKDDDPIRIFDHADNEWTVGWIKGICYRRRVR